MWWRGVFQNAGVLVVLVWLAMRPGQFLFYWGQYELNTQNACQAKRFFKTLGSPISYDIDIVLPCFLIDFAGRLKDRSVFLMVCVCVFDAGRRLTWGFVIVDYCKSGDGVIVYLLGALLTFIIYYHIMKVCVYSCDFVWEHGKLFYLQTIDLCFDQLWIFWNNQIS